MDLDKQREKYYRVTEVLCPFSGYGSSPSDLMKKYQRRGTIAHKACNRFTEIGADWWMDFSIDGIAATDEEIDIAKPFVESFALWFDPTIMQIVEKERRLYDDELELTGEFDLIVMIDGVRHIVDLKTSKTINKTWRYQLAAYHHLLKYDNYYEHSILQLNADGSKANFIEYDNCDEDIAIFKKAFELYKIFCSKKRVIYEETE